MKNFDWNKFKKGTIAVTFKTKDEEQNFLKECEKRNIVWNITKEKPTKNSYWDKNNVAYKYKGNGLVWFNDVENMSIDWSDYMKQDTYETFTKDMLKDGMVVELNNGQLSCKFADKLFLEDDDYYLFKNYDDNLNHFHNDYLNIIKIYSVKSSIENIKDIFHRDYLELIWERKEEPKEMTQEEIEKILGYKVKIVTDKTN